MTTRDIVADLASIVLPLPSVGPDADVDVRDGIADEANDVRQKRMDFEENARLAWDDGDCEPLLSTISTARHEMLAAEKRMRLLLAYGREFVEPRPYRLEDLAQAAGMSISGVRTAYDDDEIADVAQLTGRRRRTRNTA